MDDEKARLISMLRQKGMRVTKQKHAILGVLFDHTDRMLSVFDIGEIIGDQMDNATIYRNVRKFTELGILESMVDSKGVQRYVICCDGKHHHHFICTVCGRIINFPCNNPFWRGLAQQHRFSEEYHRIEVFGACADCQ